MDTSMASHTHRVGSSVATKTALASVSLFTRAWCILVNVTVSCNPHSAFARCHVSAYDSPDACRHPRVVAAFQVCDGAYAWSHSAFSFVHQLLASGNYLDSERACRLRSLVLSSAMF
jgi:hypothetical protein